MALPILSPSDQVAVHLREEILSGRWKEEMPGVAHFQKELGVNNVTINAALQLLEKEGLLVGQGRRKRRRINMPKQLSKARKVRVRILLYERAGEALAVNSELLSKLQEAGYAASFARKSLADLGMDVGRVAKFVKQAPVDAWIVIAGSRDVLEWFSSQPVPAFAMFGVKSGLPIAGTGPRKDLGPLINRLVALGHRRIVMLARDERLLPKPAFFEQSFLDELRKHGIKPNSYNLPNWGHSADDFHHCLDSLLQLSPPTALLIIEPKQFFAARDYLAQRGIIAPRDVSLICMDHDLTFTWCKSEIACFKWDFAPIMRRILRWLNHVDHGKDDRRQSYIKAKFIEGGTIGAVPKR
jgi:DNA-binding LacI/PurR family transcriptional regulator